MYTLLTRKCVLLLLVAVPLMMIVPGRIAAVRGVHLPAGREPMPVGNGGNAEECPVGQLL